MRLWEKQNESGCLFKIGGTNRDYYQIVESIYISTSIVFFSVKKSQNKKNLFEINHFYSKE